MTTTGEVKVIEAILNGILDARNSHLDKDYDIALSVFVAISEAGYKIIRKPGRK